jgi:hypothetical protein
VLKRTLGRGEASVPSEAVDGALLSAVAARVRVEPEPVRTLAQVIVGDRGAGPLASGSTPASARAWVKQFVTPTPAKPLGVNAALRVTVPTTASTPTHPVARDVS